MGPVVRSLILKGFRSVSAGRIDFDNPTFLVGRNGSGKSNIADAFAFLADAMVYPLREVLDRRGGISSILHKTPGMNRPTHLGLAVHCDYGELLKTMGEIRNGDEFGKHERSDHSLGLRYALEIEALPEYRFEVSREQCIVSRLGGSPAWFDRKKRELVTNAGPSSEKTTKMTMMSAESLALPTLTFGDAFLPVIQVLHRMRVYSIDPACLRDMQDPDSGVSLKRSGANAASVLDEVSHRAPDQLRRIQQFLSAIVPQTNRVAVAHHGKKLSLEFTQNWGNNEHIDFEAFNMSDGTLRAFGLLLAIFQRETPTLMIVEEPEASIHPAAAGAILDLLRHASSRMQVIVSTHSPEILDAKWIEDKHLRVVTWQKGATQVSNVSELSKKALQQHLMGAGELLRSDALESDALFEDVDHSQLSLFEEVR